MKNKPDDILYCGVDVNKIKSAKPKLRQEMLQKYRDYQYKRADIYYKKEILKESAPWTDDVILQKYSFTNVKRHFDKESKILLNNTVYNENCSLKNALLNIAFIRAFYTRAYILNNLDTGFIDFSNTSSEYMNYLTQKLPENIKNRAYAISGTRKGAFIAINDKSENKVSRLVKYLQKFQDKIYDTYINCNNPYDILESNILGLSTKFIAYQILMDLGYHKDFKFSNNEFVFSGPGCSRGIAFLCEDMDGLNDEEFMFWLRDNISDLIDFEPSVFLHFCEEDDKVWSINDIENSFCEFSKYIKLERMMLEGVRTKQIYYKGNDCNSLSDF